MKYINIFLASSIDDMKLDRIEFGNYIRTLNDRFVSRDLYIRLHMCEDISDEIAHVRKQDEYNDIIRQCDYFYIMVWHRLGGYTKEEFDVALENFHKKSTPKISTFFKNADSEIDETVTEFMEELDRGLNHYYTRFSSVDSIKFKILMQITDDPGLSAKLEFKNSNLLLDGKCIGGISLENLPFYRNNKGIAELKASISDIEEKITEARNLCRTAPSDENLDAWRELELKKQNLNTRLHNIETALLDTTSHLTRLESSGKLVNQRTKKAIALFDSGLLEETLAVLNEEDFQNDLSLLKQQKAALDISAETLLEERLTTVKVLKSQGLTEENIERIIRCYSDARDIVCDHGLDRSCIIEYMWFLREQKLYTDAAEIGEKLYYDFKRKNPHDPAVWAKFCCDLGILYRDINRTKEAEKLLCESLEIRRKLASTDPERHLPNLAYTYNSLGILYRLTDRIAEAERAYKEGYAIWDKLAKRNPRKYGGDKANICNNYAYLYLRVSRFEEAYALFSEALSLRLELAKTDPDEQKLYIGRICNNIGELCRLMGRPEDAEEYLLEGLKLRQESVKINPINLTYTAGSSSSLGVLYTQLGKYNKAEEYFRDAIRIYRHRTEENYDSYASYLADNCADLGDILHRTGNFKEAITLLDEALSIYRKIANTDPLQYRAGLARVSILRGVLYSTCRDEETAFNLFSEAYSVLSELAKAIPVAYSGPAACASYNAACSLHSIGEHDQAKKLFERTLDFAQHHQSENKECAAICALIQTGNLKHIAPLPSHIFSK